MKKIIWILVCCVWISTCGATEESEKIAIASLPEGISIDLIGLRSYAALNRIGLKQWWRPDGGQLIIAPDKRTDVCSWPDSYLFVINVEDSNSCSFKAVGPWDNDLTVEPVREIDKPEEFTDKNLYRFTLRLGEQKNADIQLAVATGDWEILENWPFSSNGTPYDFFYPSHYGAIMRCPEQNGRDIIAEITQTITDIATRLVVFDRDGNQYVSYGIEGGATDNLIRYIHYFRNLNKDVIDHLEFQARPYNYLITFQDISLRMGQKTAVNLEIKKPGYLLPGEALPSFANIKIDISEATTKEKMMLVCFFDYEQRPSRNCILQLAEQAEQLEQKEVAIVAIQASTTEQDTLDEWVKENNITFPIEMIEADPSTSLGTGVEEIRFNWGVKSLPWLILTDKEHKVIAEGFSISDLEENLKKMGE